MAVTAFMPISDAPGDVNHEVIQTMPSQRAMIFQDSEVEMRDRAGVLETAVDNAVDHGSPPECAEMLRDIVFRTHLGVLYRALSIDPPARKKLWRSSFIQGQGWRGQSPHLTLNACGGVRQSLVPTGTR